MYTLSKFVPVRFKSTYTVESGARETATWWQWRNRIYRHTIS